MLCVSVRVEGEGDVESSTAGISTVSPLTISGSAMDSKSSQGQGRVGWENWWRVRTEWNGNLSS